MVTSVQPLMAACAPSHERSLHDARWAAWMAKDAVRDEKLRLHVCTLLFALAAATLIGSAALLGL